MYPPKVQSRGRINPTGKSNTGVTSLTTFFMMVSIMMLLPLSFGSLLFLAGAANLPGTVWETTECKTCPYSLCSNAQIYDRDEHPNTTFTCWTEGTNIYNDTTWFRTVDNCYVAQYDVEESTDASDLPYCGSIKQPKWPQRNGRTRYYSDCYFMPYIDVDGNPTKMYKYNINLNLLCVARNVTGTSTQGHEFLGKNTWYKTNSNCFVHETTIWPVEDDIEDCGPLDSQMSERIPPETTTPDPVPDPTSTIEFPTSTASPSASVGARSLHASLSRRYLYNTTIGEEYVNCTATSNSTDRAHGVKRVYEFDQAVYPQCGSYDGDVIMLFTTDFCWIRDDECWVQLQDSLFRVDTFPHCEHFTDEVS